MAKPVLLLDDDAGSRQGLLGELEARYSAHYRIISSGSAEEGLAWLQALRSEGASVPLVLADQWMPGLTGVQFLARVRELYPTAWRGC